MKHLYYLLILNLIAIGSSAQLSNGLVAKYYFNYGNAVDNSGNNYNADTVTASLAFDRCNNANHAYSFNGTQFINVPFSAPFNLNEISISVWFKPSNHDSLWQRIITLPVGGLSGDQHFSVIYNPSIAKHKVMIYFDPGPGYSIVDDTVNDNKWHHYVGTISVADSRIISFLDGKPQDTTAFTSAPSSGGGALQIGRFNNVYNQYFFGSIDDIRIYNRPISALEADSLSKESCSIIGIDQKQGNNSYTIFPNPTHEKIILSGDFDHPVDFILMNSLGEILLKQEIYSNESINLNFLPSGIYFYVLQFEPGKSQRGKLIKN